MFYQLTMSKLPFFFLGNGPALSTPYLQLTDRAFSLMNTHTADGQGRMEVKSPAKGSQNQAAIYR